MITLFKIILANGFSDRGGYTYYYSNYKVVMNNFKDGDFRFLFHGSCRPAVNIFYVVGDETFYFDMNDTCRQDPETLRKHILLRNRRKNGHRSGCCRR